MRIKCAFVQQIRASFPSATDRLNQLTETVVTEAMDWGGWRVPAAEYDRDPHRIEAQARLLANSPRLLEIAEHLAALAGEDGELPPALAELSRRAESVLKDVNTKPAKRDGRSESRAA